MPLDNNTLELDDQGNIVVEEDEFGNQSPRVISGIASMVQDIRMRLTTPLGQLPMHPEVGFPIKQALGIMNAPYIEAETKRSVLLSPDVEEVPHVEATIEPGDGRIRRASVLLDAVSREGEVGTAEVEF